MPWWAIVVVLAVVDAWTRRNGSGLVWAVVIDLVVVDVSGGGRTLRTVNGKVRKKEKIEKHTLLGFEPLSSSLAATNRGHWPSIIVL